MLGYGSVTAPAAGAFAITTSDTGNFYATALYVGTGGDVKVDMEDTDDTAIVFSNVPAGTVLPIRVKRVYATGTTASNIVGLR
jgi:hypothetical protein